MGRRDRDRKTARKKATRDARPRILIVSEGKNTEPDYLEGLSQQARNPRVKIHVVGGKGTPHTIVRVAKKLREEARIKAQREDDDNLIYEEVWCVFDRDEFDDIPDAYQMALANEIHIAFSNPNFELWLLLHFRDAPGGKHRDIIAEMLREELPSYDKRKKKVAIADFIIKYPDAVRRAKSLCAREDDRELWDRVEYTDVHLLTELITATNPEPPSDT